MKMNMIKITALVLLFTQSLVLLASNRVDHPLLVVLLMVKDEATVIVPTLETYLPKAIKDGMPDDGRVAFFIFDTGSTDNTEKIAEDYLREKGIQQVVTKQEPFINFGASRNRALELTEAAFPDSTFIVFVDAEWYLNDIEGMLTYCNEHKNDPLICNCYSIILIDPRPLSFPVPRLLRTAAKVRFEGRIHEARQKHSLVPSYTAIYFDYKPSREGWEKTEKRWKRDRDWLLEDFIECPSNKRTLSLLGQTYANLQDWEMARVFYKKVTECGYIDEYDYNAFFCLGEITEIINGISGKTTEQDWFEAYRYYIKAYELRPHRAEPLIKIAWHYHNTKDMATSYIFTKRACELEYPCNDVLFVEKNMYDFDRYRLLGINAYYVNDFKAGEEAVRKALAVRPGDSALEYDLSCYENRKKAL